MANPMVKHSQTVRCQIANKLFEWVWPFCGFFAESFEYLSAILAHLLTRFWLMFPGYKMGAPVRNGLKFQNYFAKYNGNLVCNFYCHYWKVNTINFKFWYVVIKAEEISTLLLSWFDEENSVRNICPVGYVFDVWLPEV